MNHFYFIACSAASSILFSNLQWCKLTKHNQDENNKNISLCSRNVGYDDELWWKPQQ
jgi:hypothetical protein